MWRIAENKPSVGPLECGDGPAQRVSNQSGPDANVRETVSDSGGPWLGPLGSGPRNALALAHPTTRVPNRTSCLPFFYQRRLMFRAIDKNVSSGVCDTNDIDVCVLRFPVE